MNKPRLVGVTGGIGSGKTTVVNLFKDLGIPVYITDAEAKRLMQEDRNLVQDIKKKFGENAYKNDVLDKTYISKIVFDDSAKLKTLNAIVHPAVRRDFNLWALAQKSPYVIYESALIFEHDQQDLFDDIILVTAPENLRIERVKKRSGLSEIDIKSRMKQQMVDKFKKPKSKYIIENIIKKELKSIVNNINVNILKNTH
jgi:dephospho-CoA kinase